MGSRFPPPLGPNGTRRHPSEENNQPVKTKRLTQRASIHSCIALSSEINICTSLHTPPQQPVVHINMNININNDRSFVTCFPHRIWIFPSKICTASPAVNPQKHVLLCPSNASAITFQQISKEKEKDRLAGYRTHPITPPSIFHRGTIVCLFPLPVGSTASLPCLAT